ncbi:uncharacterized protein LOC109827998 [Asparagus officinalis]|uniref:uncharacterized protein LOC109827998 n=1 Tax=Asparagus officinalis TaxID=4686 RepID=UPI00098E49BD|nr:uncharacterized protein LOC109827998 [Asparagus officinalis]
MAEHYLRARAPGPRSKMEDSLLKLNTDAVVPIERDVVGLRGVIYDHHEHVIRCYSMGLRGPMTVDHTKLLVVLEDIRFVWRMNWRISVVEVDSLRVVFLVNSHSPFATMTSIADEVHAGLSTIGRSKVSYVRRTGNGVAHALAKSVDCLSSYFWSVSIPLFLRQSVVEDLTG